MDHVSHDVFSAVLTCSLHLCVSSDSRSYLERISSGEIGCFWVILGDSDWKLESADEIVAQFKICCVMISNNNSIFTPFKHS